MSLFRHKKKKSRFQYLIALALVVRMPHSPSQSIVEMSNVIDVIQVPPPIPKYLTSFYIPAQVRSNFDKFKLEVFRSRLCQDLFYMALMEPESNRLRILYFLEFPMR